MLDEFRKRKNNWFFTLLVVSTAIVMGFFGVSQCGRDDDRSSSGVAATVNGEVISRREFAQALESKMAQYQQMLGSQYDEKFLYAMQVPSRTLDEMVQRKLLLQQSKKAAFGVSPEEVADQLRTNPYLQKDGKFDLAAYKANPNRGAIELDIKEQIQRSRYASYISDRIRLTPLQIQNEALLKATKIDLQYATINFSQLAPPSTPNAKELGEFKTSGAAEIKSYYETHKSEYSDKAQVRIRRIRASVPFKATEDVKKKAKEKIDTVAKDLKPETFENAAKEKSDDEFANKGGDMGWVVRGTLDGSIESAIDKLKPNEISPVIETPSGYFIVQLLENKPATQKPLDSVTDTIATKLLQDKAKAKWSEETRTSWDALLAQGKSIEPQLKNLKVEIKKTGPFSISQGQIPNIGQVDTVLDALSEMSEKNPLPKRLFLYQDNYYFVKLASLKMPKTDEVVKAQEEAEKSASGELQNEVFKQLIDDLTTKASIKKVMNFGKQAGGPGATGGIPETEEN